MILLLPMAGLGSRFAKEYVTPKPMLPIGNTPLFKHVIQQWDGLVDRVIILYNPDLTSPHAHSPNEWEWVPAPNTKSPLETLSLASCLLTEDTPLIVNYVDCWITQNEIFKAAVLNLGRKGKAALLTAFFSYNPRFSPVQTPSMPGMVAGGVAGFNSARQFGNEVRDASAYYYPTEVGMPNVAELMRCDYWGCELGRTYIDVGTPEDYARYLRGWRQ